jgi:hypothetical protein
MGESGGRKAPVTVADSCAGIMQLVHAAANVQSPSAPTTTSAPPAYESFVKKIKEDICVFAGYDGELLPW